MLVLWMVFDGQTFVYFQSSFEEDSHVDQNFSNGLKAPPTRSYNRH